MDNAQTFSRWVAYTKPDPGAKLRLLCLPYAGGSAQIYRSWRNHIQPGIDVCPVQLPGRGVRIKESPFTDLMSLVDAMFEVFDPLLNLPFAFFGHSMGAAVSFELARRIRDERGVEPAHIFISGRRTSQIPDTNPVTFNLPEPEFIEELRRLQGTPKEVLENPELMQLVLPLLKSDFELCQTYKYKPGPRLTCPMTVFGGSEDKDVPRELLEPWRELTTGPFTLKMFQGDHFFLHAHEAEILKILNMELGRVMSKL